MFLFCTLVNGHVGSNNDLLFCANISIEVGGEQCISATYFAFNDIIIHIYFQVNNKIYILSYPVQRFRKGYNE